MSCARVEGQDFVLMERREDCSYRLGGRGGLREPQKEGQSSCGRREEKAVAAGGPGAVSCSTGKLKGELQKQASLFIREESS